MTTASAAPGRLRLSALTGFWPKQQAATVAADAHKFTLFGGTRGPGKSRWLRWYLLRKLIKFARQGVREVKVGLFCEDYPVLRDRQISKIKTEFPAWLGTLKATQTDGLGFYLRPEYGGGLLALRNLDDPDKYMGAEFACIAVDQLEKNPESTFNSLRGSLRWPGLPDAALKFVATANPGGVGHLWVKSYFVDGQLPERLKKYADQFCFVRALPEDNPALDAAYWDWLESLPAALAKAWRWGDWDTFEGQVFSFTRERHVIAPVELPRHWLYWRAVDWGYANPWCCLWFARDPDRGRVYGIREAYATGLTDRQQARRINDLTPEYERIAITYADPSMWTKKAFEDQTFSTFDEYRAAGVPLTKADNDRLIGKRKVDTLLADLPDGKPGLLIFETCPNLIRTLPALVHDSVYVEDVDTGGEDHPYDTLRYGLTSIKPPPPPRAAPAPVTDGQVGRVKVRANAGLRSRDL